MYSNNFVKVALLPSGFLWYWNYILYRSGKGRKELVANHHTIISSAPSYNKKICKYCRTGFTTEEAKINHELVSGGNCKIKGYVWDKEGAVFKRGNKTVHKLTKKELKYHSKHGDKIGDSPVETKIEKPKNYNKGKEFNCLLLFLPFCL